MLTEVGEQKLANVPQMEPVRRALLKKALKFYQAFLEQKSDDPVVMREVGRAYGRTTPPSMGEEWDGGDTAAAPTQTLPIEWEGSKRAAENLRGARRNRAIVVRNTRTRPKKQRQCVGSVGIQVP